MLLGLWPLLTAGGGGESEGGDGGAACAAIVGGIVVLFLVVMGIARFCEWRDDRLVKKVEVAIKARTAVAPEAYGRYVDIKKARKQTPLELPVPPQGAYRDREDAPSSSS